MVAFAEPSDVEAIWRPLTPAETARVDVLLEYASELIRQAVPRVDEWIGDGALSPTAARYVAVQMVYGFMLNPEGRRQGQQSIDDFSESWTLVEARASGGLVLTDYLLGWLRPAAAAPTGAFTIHPGAPARVWVPDARR